MPRTKNWIRRSPTMCHPVAQTIRDAFSKIHARAMSMLFKAVATLYHNSKTSSFINDRLHLDNWRSSLET